MGCCVSEQKREIENEFDLIWGSLKKSDLFKPQQLKKHVNGKVYFELLFSKFLLYFYLKIQNKIEQLLALEGEKLVKKLQQEMEQMQLQKYKLKRKEEEIVRRYPQIVSDLLSARSSNQKEDWGQKKMMNNRQSGKSVNNLKIVRQKQNEEMRKSTLNQGVEIECTYISEQQSYQIPATIVDQNECKMETSEMSYVKMNADLEEMDKINERLQFQMEKRRDHEDRIITLTYELEKVKEECNLLNKQKKEREKAENKAELSEKYHPQLQELKRQTFELKQKITALSTQNQSLHLKTLQLQKQLQSLKSDQPSFPKSILSLNNSTSPQQQQSNNIALRSFIILDPQQKKIEEDASQNIIRGCEIIFKLFPDSKLLPNHTLFQTAVGVRTIIGEMFGRPIRGSKLLYSYDSITLSSFGKYIENHSNLFAIFRLKNGTLVGGFAGKIDEEGFLDSSFLFSVRSQKEPIKIPAKRRVPRIDKEPGMMLFGAGELSIKIKTLELNCNLGCMQAYYGFQRKRTVSADVFLGDSESPQPLEGYQIYQLEFREVL